ncbi:MAG: DUF4347 domain-containing protein [Cyanobacteria bacterium P01_D01_bin.105]
MSNNLPTPTAQGNDTLNASLPQVESGWVPDFSAGHLNSQHIAFVDSSLQNIESLIATIENAAIYVIDAQQDGVAVISDVLNDLSTPYSSLHIFAHGSAGAVQLGATTLTADTLADYSSELTAWGQSQTQDVLLYGCDVAQGETGSAFINQLVALTGADIQASNDLTGSAALGGDWDLEATFGSVESGLVISEKGQADYRGTLASPVITSNGGGNTATVSVSETETFITDVQVIGANVFAEGFGVEYYFSGGDDSYLFNIDVDTGVVTFDGSFADSYLSDVDRNNTYEINVLAIDWTGASDTQAISVVVELDNGSGNGGGFDLANDTNITVNSGESFAVDLSVTGAGGGFDESFGVEYYFFGGADSYLFNLNNNTGVLTFDTPPDVNNPIDVNGDNVYDVRILAIDYAGQSVERSLSITVQDTPNPPEIPTIISNGGGDTAIIELSEGTTVVTDVTATAANGFSEGNGFTYSLNAGDDADKFNIDPTTGVISFKSVPDFENPSDADGNNVYFANVLVQDPTGAADSQFLSIVVTDITESSSAPVINSSGGGDSAFIQTPENETFAVDVQATDADGDTEGNGLTYRINDGEDADKFNIDANTGVISFKVAPDFENPLDSDTNNIYRINVLVEDSAGQADSQFIQIEVTNKVAVYLLGGQSNMAGETSDASFLSGTPQANPLPDVQIWNGGFGSFTALRPGFNNNFGIGGGFGAELGFGHALEAARDSGTFESEEIYLIKYAIGATNLAEDWNVNLTGNIYGEFTQWADAALAKLTSDGIGYDIEGMLWMQGENDAISASSAAAYETNLNNLIANVRSRYSANLDFVIGRLHEELTPFFYTELDTVRQAQVNVANDDPQNYWINTDDLIVNPIDGVHFDSSGHLALGELFANIFLS